MPGNVQGIFSLTDSACGGLLARIRLTPASFNPTYGLQFIRHTAMHTVQVARLTPPYEWWFLSAVRGTDDGFYPPYAVRVVFFIRRTRFYTGTVFFNASLLMSSNSGIVDLHSILLYHLRH